MRNAVPSVTVRTKRLRIYARIPSFLSELWMSRATCPEGAEEGREEKEEIKFGGAPTRWTLDA